MFVFAAAAVVVTQPAWAISAFETAFPRVVFRVSTHEKLVALTFDDGPLPEQTARVLAVLARHDAHATFFIVGGHAIGAPATIEDVRRAGHELANHSYRHGPLINTSEERIRQEVQWTERVLKSEGSMTLFRPPSAKFDEAQLDVMERLGYRVVLGSAYPFDTSRPPAAYVEWLIKKNLRPGAIVILHDGVGDPTRMLEGLDRALEYGTSQGYRFVTVSRLLRAAG